MPGAVVDVGAMTQAVERLVACQPLHVEGVSEELDDTLHEVITRVFAELGADKGYQYVVSAVLERRSIQHAFDGIDQLVVTFG